MAKPQRPGKGESVLCLPRDYTVVATETTIKTTRRSIVIYLSLFLKFWINKIDTSI